MKNEAQSPTGLSRREAARRRVERVLQAPRQEILAEIRSRSWHGHNIPLTSSESTIDASRSLIGDDRRTTVIKSCVRQVFGESERLRVLDLGALEGGLAFEMAREGWDTVGMEGRATNYEKCELIRRYFELDNLSFQHRDVKTLSRARDGDFDVILCCGLLYHLNDPVEFLHTLRGVVTDRGFLFLDTHVAPADPAATLNTTPLSELVTIQNRGRSYEGRWAREPREGSVLDREWSAVSNEESLGLTHRSLIRAIYHAGFQSISELFGMFDIDGEFGLRDAYSRAYFVCKPTW
ncbi:MAG TPA: methyltransferase domain-containing protein [Thermoanaerobaculia bacterium]|nr:methyltransferase domain-containing protein [Thermoanaerobaculia bacterium]